MDTMTETLKYADVYPDKAGKVAQRLHIKKDDIKLIRKFYVSEKHEPINEAERKKLAEEKSLISYISTDSVDRDGEVLLASGMRDETFTKSGQPVFWAHSYGEPRDVIGQSQWRKLDADKKGVIAKTAFRNTQFADEVYNLYTEDLTGQGPVLRGVSVGFIPISYEEPTQKEGSGTKAPKRIYTEWELLEYSLCPLQSNRDAISLAMQKGMITSNQLKKDLNISDNGADLLSEEHECKKVITKPETIDQYHRIPVNPGCKITATITISEKDGIKALYCGGDKDKKVHTYLFDRSCEGE